MNGLDVLYAGVGVIAAPFWMRKARGGWRERFGRTVPLPEKHRPRVLLHAVSVGEANALRRLVPILAERAEVVVSTTTDTGLARGRSLYADVARVVRYPLDFSGAVARFLDAVRPDVVGLVELEVWPNFLRGCGKRGVPVGVINGRLSERSFAGYHRWRGLVGPRLFEPLAFVAAQDEAYAERFRAMGARNVSVTGSMKWDSVEPVSGSARRTPEAIDLARALGLDLTRPVVVGASTAEDEEGLLHEACAAGVQLVCAPRKPERFDAAAGLMPGCHRRSSGEAAPAGTTRFLLDSIGELGTLCRVADLVVMGRSFGTLHGSDPLEPAALGAPVLIGPEVGDFRAIVETLTRAEAIVRTTREKLGADLARLLGDPAARSGLVERAQACVRGQQGASRRHADLLAGLLTDGVRSGAD